MFTKKARGCCMHVLLHGNYYFSLPEDRMYRIEHRLIPPVINSCSTLCLCKLGYLRLHGLIIFHVMSKPPLVFQDERILIIDPFVRILKYCSHILFIVLFPSTVCKPATHIYSKDSRKSQPVSCKFIVRLYICHNLTVEFTGITRRRKSHRKKRELVINIRNV